MSKLFLILLFSTSALAKDFSKYKLLDVDTISVDYRQIKPNKREPYLPERDGEWRKGANFNLSLRLLRWIRWDNNLHMDGGSGRLYHAGWEYRFIMDAYRVQPFMYHHSQHALEDSPNGNKFPVEDSYGVRFVFIEKGRK